MIFKDCYCLHNGEKLFFARVKMAKKIFDRARGLLFRPILENGAGMYFPGCNSVHTCFMAYPIDVIYLDKQNHVIKIVSALKPWAFSGSLRATSVIEVSSGYAKKKQLTIGSKMHLDSVLL
jgi:uncharacterized protein